MNTLEHALAYAAIGWPVFPVHTPVDGRCSCGDATCTSPAKHPRNAHGLTEATTDTDIIRGWWKQWPDANVGLRTGDMFDVLDIDGEPANRALAIAADLAGENTATCWAGGPMVITARGTHIYYQPTGARNTTGLIVPKVDWRGGGGYVVAPPSVHMSGHIYRWHERCPFDSELELAPAFIVAALFKLQPAPQRTQAIGNVGAALDGIAARMTRAGEGERNAMLNWGAHTIGLKVHSGEIDNSAARDALLKLTDAALSVGLGATEIERTITSGFTAGRDGKRQIA